MRPYRPDNKSSILGIFLLLLVTVFGGLILGILLFLVGQFIYIIVLFPAIVAIVGGSVLQKIVKTGKIRITLLAGICGMLMGFIIYGSYLSLSYIAFRYWASITIFEQAPQLYRGLSDSSIDKTIDQKLKENTGESGFVGYLFSKSRKAIGVMFDYTILAGVLEGKGGITFGPFLTWVYWLIELTIIVGFPTYYAIDTASQPFCQIHNQWYGKKQRIGGIPETYKRELLKLLNTGKLATVGEISQSATAIPRIDLNTQKCDICINNNDVYLQVEKVWFGNMRLFGVNQAVLQSRQILQGWLSPILQAELLRGIKIGEMKNITRENEEDDDEYGY